MVNNGGRRVLGSASTPKQWYWMIGSIAVASIVMRLVWNNPLDSMRWEMGSLKTSWRYISARSLQKNLTLTKTAAEDLVGMLEEYYTGHAVAKKMMLDSWLTAWNVNSTNKLVHTMAKAIVSEDQAEFVITVMGSSVPAGSGNCFYDAYPSQLERTFGPIWEAAGMKLVVHNTGCGQSGDDFRNQVYCVEQLVSPESDIIHYSWTLYESGKNDLAVESRESLVRWAQFLPRQPPVHVLNLFLLPARGDKEYELAEHYSEHGYNAFYSKSALFNGGFDYNSPALNGTDYFAWGHVGDGYHNTTRYGESEDNSTRRESLGVVMRNWHPGPLYFQLIADTFAYAYSKQALIEAIALIENEINDGNDPKGIWAAGGSTPPLPPPKFCDPSHCLVSKPPACLNFGEPKFGKPGISVFDADDKLNPHRGEIQQWKIWYDASDMKGFVPKEDQAFFRDKNYSATCAHKWRVGGISATSAKSGTVAFRLPASEVGLVVVCVASRNLDSKEILLESDGLEIRYNGRVLERSTFVAFLHFEQKCVQILKAFPPGSSKHLPATLAIRAVNITKLVAISHVIVL